MADKLTTTPLTLPVWPDLANPKVPTNLVTFWTVLKNVDFKTKLLWLYIWNKFGHFLFWHYTSPKLTFNFYNFLIELAPGLKFSLSFRVNSNSICQREDPGTKRKFSTKKLISQTLLLSFCYKISCHSSLRSILAKPILTRSLTLPR